MTLKEIKARGEIITEEEAIQGLHDSIAEAQKLQAEAKAKGDEEEAMRQAGYAAGCNLILAMYESYKSNVSHETKRKAEDDHPADKR